MDASSVDAVIALANAHLGAEKYNDAIRTLRGAIDGSPDNVDDRLRQALQRAEAALKQSKQVNYYKVLDVPRTADNKAIKSAYRKVRRSLSHPTPFKGPLYLKCAAPRALTRGVSARTQAPPG